MSKRQWARQVRFLRPKKRICNRASRIAHPSYRPLSELLSLQFPLYNAPVGITSARK